MQSGHEDFGQSVAIQPDGKIVVAGSADNGTDDEFAVARYNTDGTLDNSFSADGKVTTAFGTGDDYGCSVAIQPDENRSGRRSDRYFAFIGNTIAIWTTALAGIGPPDWGWTRTRNVSAASAGREDRVAGYAYRPGPAQHGWYPRQQLQCGRQSDHRLRNG
ncbi:MAG: hypothetical protein IPH05_18875 [Flavobacteriales bacterium]|nr:hypothetical protein [Flavobacteriales bacterium]